MSSASRCSSTARTRLPARGPRAAARGATSTTRAPSPPGSASRTTCSTTRAASASQGHRRPSPTATSRGETPIPCVSCNQHVKFDDLFATARDLGADALATGHYVSSRAAARGRRAGRCSAPATPSRDQSYFLYATTQRAARPAALPPRGDGPRPRRCGARPASSASRWRTSRDSQDICFVPSGRYGDLIEQAAARAPPPPGDIVDIRTAACSGGMPASSTTRSGSGAASGSAESPAGPTTEPLYRRAPSMRPRARVVVGPREALATARGGGCAT